MMVIWGNSSFIGLNDTSFPFTVGPTFTADSIGKIFDVQWAYISEKILETTLQREETKEWDLADINVYLASQLVMGLTPQPSIDNYFQHDSRGIFGSSWMQETFTKKEMDRDEFLFSF
jgi:hypothetical protein